MEAILDSLTPTYPNDPPQSLAELDACLLDMEEARSRNAFYFWNHAQLGQLSAKIKGMQRRIYRHHFHLLTQSFRDLRDQGELSPKATRGVRPGGGRHPPDQHLLAALLVHQRDRSQLPPPGLGGFSTPSHPAGTGGAGRAGDCTRSL